jgi:anthranilate/para-aminobenzoate synthase component I
VLFDEERKTVLLGCRPSERRDVLDPEPALALDPDAPNVPRWIGLLPYEAFRDLERPRFVPARETRAVPHISAPRWYRYGAVAVLGERDACVVGDAPEAVAHLADLLENAPPQPNSARASLELIEPAEPGERHIARIERALEHITAGDLYQVNLARRFAFRVRGHAIEVLTALGPAARAPFAAALGFEDLAVVSCSPELFLDVDASGKLVTRPIKGTRPRGETPAEDACLRLELDSSEKERAELAMVIDVERSDFGRVAMAGSVHLSELPHVVSHPTVLHREATVRAQLRPGVTREELLRATLPSGSVTGAPKIRAMEVIASLEAERRGLYTGALGTLGHDGSLRLSMAIRTLTIADGIAHYFSGGGIVADSNPAAEVEETHWKARQLTALAPHFE